MTDPPRWRDLRCWCVWRSMTTRSSPIRCGGQTVTLEELVNALGLK